MRARALSMNKKLNAMKLVYFCGFHNRRAIALKSNSEDPSFIRFWDGTQKPMVKIVESQQ